MSPQERPPVIDERLVEVGRWIQANFSPVLRVITQGGQLGEVPPQQEFQIRPYQLEAWANVWDARQGGADRGLVQLATGLGKTSVAVFDFLKFREECRQAGLSEPKGLFVSHQGEINNQAAERFRYYIPDLEISFFDTQQMVLPRMGMTFANVQGLTNKLDSIDPRYFDYIVYDEAHHMKADTWESVVEHFRPRFMLALTATPNRMDRRDIREHFGAELYSKNLPEAIAEGWLVDVDYHIVFDEIVRQLMEEGFEPKTLKELHELFKVKPRNEIIAKNIREERHKIGLDEAKTIIFCPDVTYAEEMAELMAGAAYHSGVDRDEQRRILRNFRTGSTQVICTVDMFNEGIDIPDARLVVFLRSTQSETIFEQQLGRGLRRAFGKDKVSVLDFVANVERIAKVRELSQRIRNASGNGTNGGEPGSKGGGGAICTRPDDNEGGETEGTSGGLNVHTTHGDFDFDRLAVDLLEKWGELNAVPEAPEGWMSVNGFVKAFSTTHYIVYKLLGGRRDDLPIYLFGSNNRSPALSPDLQAWLLTHEELAVGEAPEGWLSIIAFAKKNGVSPQSVRSALGTAVLDEMPRYRFKGAIAPAVSPAQQLELQRLPSFQAPKAPEGWLSITGFAERTGVSIGSMHRIVKKVLAASGQTLPDYKFGPRVAPALSPDLQAELVQLPELQVPPMPEGFVSIEEFSAQHGTSRMTTSKALKDLGIEPKSYRAKGRGGRSTVARGLSPVEQKQLASHSGFQAQPAPAGWKSVSAFSRELRTSPQTLQKLLEEMGIATSSYRFKSIIASGISPEDQENVRRRSQ